MLKISKLAVIQEDVLIADGKRYQAAKHYDAAYTAFAKALAEIGTKRKEILSYLRILLEIHLALNLSPSVVAYSRRCYALMVKYQKLDPSLSPFLQAANEIIEAAEAENRLAVNPSQRLLARPNTLFNSVRAEEKVVASTTGIENLTFQGGGIKGVAYLGALYALSKHMNLQQIKRYAGTSAGAITATLLGIGLQLHELEDLVKNTPFTQFMDGVYREKLLAMLAPDKQSDLKDKVSKARENLGIFNGSELPHRYVSAGSELVSLASDPDASIIKEGLQLLAGDENGLFPGNSLREWVEQQLFERTKIHNLTFAELHELAIQKPNEGYRDIYLVAANISTHTAEVFSYLHTPDAIISYAVRLSVSIPLVFTPERLYIKDAVSGLAIPDSRGCWYVDGGLIDNYPIAIFDKSDDNNEVTQVYGKSNPRSLGFRLVNTEEKSRYEGAVDHTVHTRPNGLADLLTNILKTVHNRQEVLHVQRREVERTVYIDHLGISPIKFDITPQEQEQLISSGYTAVEQYWATRKASEVVSSHEQGIRAVP